MEYSISLARLAGFVVLGVFGGVARQVHAHVQPYELARPDGSAIHYYVQPAIAPQSGVRELLLIVQGSDCNSVAHKSLVWETLAKTRPQAQVLAVEKYALTAALSASDESERSDCPADYIQHDHPQQRVADLDAVLKQLQSQTHYDKIFALGGSEGAVIVHLLAAQTSYLDAVVSFNGGGRWFQDDVLYSASAQEMPADDKQAMLDGLGDFLQQAKAGLDTEMSQHGRDWWQQMLNLDQAEVLGRIGIPALIIQSGRDSSVSPQAAAEMVAHVDNPFLVWRTYPDLDHVMKQADGRSAMPQVVGDIAHWLNQLKRDIP
ncbi:prolyl oligopeptidase family serine peptidase [Alcaligenes faecalis]|uniref:prolyl oligopeptidase family serine peptidase n=1 Tax=Alcaligenes faecalis TaxID=511 RepID=UPI00293295FA|nr:prolyl oligopeptidase family serine peptidase [Alcaligenes faecalis]MDV2115786.1 prolyl oligopeptidase family serine peptidase [Alcaligenes faecalis]